MNKKFNLDDYKGKYVMHCKTEEEAKDFCRVLHEAGRTWSGGTSYLEHDNFRVYEDGMCYYFNIGEFDEIKYVLVDKSGPYTILEWSDFMKKEFTKADLSTGDILLIADGSVYVYIKESNMLAGLSENDWDLDKYYNEDLKHRIDPKLNIVAVRRPEYVSSIAENAFDKGFGRLVFEREETVEMTLEEVCKALGKNVKIVKE